MLKAPFWQYIHTQTGAILAHHNHHFVIVTITIVAPDNQPRRKEGRKEGRKDEQTNGQRHEQINEQMNE